MKPATQPNARLDARLMVLDPGASRGLHATMDALPALLSQGDVVVVNEAATLPASVHAVTAQGAPVELRLVSAGTDGLQMVALGAGDWRTDTDARPAPPQLKPADLVRLRDAPHVAWVVTGVDARSPRLLTMSGGGTEDMLMQMCVHGAPVQYAYTDRALAPHDVQTPYGAVPWAVEMPSAGRMLTVARVAALRKRGVHVVSLLHAAGLSATGDPALDALLPLPERFRIPPETAEAIRCARREGRRVVAVGTSVVRALEGAFERWGEVRACEGWTDLILTPGFVPRVVDGLLSGMHDRGSSHFRLLGAWLDETALGAMVTAGEEADYRVHEFGEHLLILRGAMAGRAGGFGWWPRTRAPMGGGAAGFPLHHG
jgi:S-adenosylmethionine:tRNA ribosyltransferase-isomerase